MPKYRAFLRCRKCKNTTFFLSKETGEYQNEAKARMSEPFLWEILKSFDVKCSLCGGDPEVYLQPIEH